jgi:hypothetical protein
MGDQSKIRRLCDRWICSAMTALIPALSVPGVSSGGKWELPANLS